MIETRYRIIETDMGPLISDSRSTVYDVLKYHRQGHNKYEISAFCNLMPLQVDTALEYIAARREVLERELDAILEIEKEREAHYRQIAAEIQQKIDQLPMTPQRAAFYALRDKNRREREARREANADCSEWSVAFRVSK